MSKHSQQYLHLWNRVGQGVRAWWHSLEIEKTLDIPSHYEGSVPLSEVRRLFGSVVPVRGDVTVTYIDPDGIERTVTDMRKRAVLNARTGDLFGYFTNDSQWRDFNSDLTDPVSHIVGGIGDLGIDSCGILSWGARAYLSVSISEDMHNDALGIAYRPRLLAATALDGTLSTTYKRVVTLAVCDNSCAAALGEDGAQVKIPHTKYSADRVKDAPTALGILSQSAEVFDASLTDMSKVDVSAAQWQAILDALVPIPTDKGHGQTRAQNTQDALNLLAKTDPRCAEWQGTLFGAWQTFNTHRLHVATRRGAGDDADAAKHLRFERNMTDLLTGKAQAADADTLRVMRKVLASV